MTKKMRIGWIGLGGMGMPMLGHVRQAGYPLAVWARRKEQTRVLADAGVTVCDTPAELATACDVVVTIILGDQDVEAVAFGPSGLAEGFKPGAIHMDMSTISPALALSLAERYSKKQVGWLDAPVSGGIQGAQEASLAVMVGGEAAALEKVQPLLDCMSRRTVHVGAAGAGQVAKACNQLTMVAMIEAVAEAMHLAEAAGLDKETVLRALAAGSAGSRVLDIMGVRMAHADYPGGVEARLHDKDIAIVLQAAAKLGVPLPVTAQVSQQLNTLMARGWGYDDTASLLRVLELQKNISSH